MLDTPRGDGGGYGEGRVRGARHVQFLPEPEPARGHGQDGGQHLRRTADTRDRQRLVPEGLRRVRLRVRDGGKSAKGPRRRDADHRRASLEAEPTAYT